MSQQHQTHTYGPDWFVTPREAAGLLGVDRPQVLRLIEHGDVEAVQHDGRNHFVLLDSLLTYRRSLPLPRRPGVRTTDPKEKKAQ